jgi:hypothetical protein
MFWAIRWTDSHSHQPKTIVLEAATRAEAEYSALKRGLRAYELAEARRRDINTARRAGLLWKYTPTPRHTFLGHRVERAQIAALLLAGVATATVHLAPHLPQFIALV